MAVMPTVEGTTRPVNFWASWSSTVGPYGRGWVTAPIVAMASVNAGSWPTTERGAHPGPVGVAELVDGRAHVAQLRHQQVDAEQGPRDHRDALPADPLQLDQLGLLGAGGQHHRLLQPGQQLRLGGLVVRPDRVAQLWGEGRRLEVAQRLHERGVAEHAMGGQHGAVGADQHPGGRQEVGDVVPAGRGLGRRRRVPEPDQLHVTVVVDRGVAEVERAVRQARGVEGAHVAPQPVEHHVGQPLGSELDQGPARALPLHQQRQLPVATDGDDGGDVHPGPLGEQRDEGLGVHPFQTGATTLGRAPVPEVVPEAGQQLGVVGVAAQRLHVQRRPGLVPTEHHDLAPRLAWGQARLVDDHAEVGHGGHDLGEGRSAFGRAEGQVHRGGDAVAEHERGRHVDQQAGRDGEGGRGAQQGDDGEEPAQRAARRRERPWRPGRWPPPPGPPGTRGGRRR